jgi:hypothetical protein
MTIWMAFALWLAGGTTLYFATTIGHGIYKATTGDHSRVPWCMSCIYATGRNFVIRLLGRWMFAYAARRLSLTNLEPLVGMIPPEMTAAMPPDVQDKMRASQKVSE